MKTSSNEIKTVRSGMGIHTFTVDGPDDFLREVRKHFRGHEKDFVWRGMRNPDWDLISSLTREIQSIPLRKHSDWMKQVSSLTLQHMVEYVSNLRGMNIIPQASLKLVDALRGMCESCTGEFVDVLNKLSTEERRHVIELFAIGQHYHLNTPFLDWSYSPQVGLYFAFEESGQRPEGVGDRVVYALNRALIEERSPSGDVWHPENIYFVDSLALDNDRVLAQDGLFTYCPTHLSIRDWVLQHGHARENEAFLIKFLIRNTGRKECLQDLNQMKINAKTIYTGRVGAALYSNGNLEGRVNQAKTL